MLVARDLAGSVCACRGSSRGARTSPSPGAILLDAILRRLGADDITPVRPVAARRARARLHRAASQGNRPGRSLPRRAAAAACSSWPNAATTGRSTRSRSRGCRSALFDQTRAIHGLTGSRARVARMRRAARHRRPHQLRGPPQALVLPHQERRSARLRAGRDRDHRARRPVSSAGARRSGGTTASAIFGRKRRRTIRTLAAILRLAEGLDRSHSQPIAGLELARPRRRRAAAAADGGRRGAGALGRARATRAPFERLIGKPLHVEVGANAQADTLMLNNLTTTARVPGKAVRRRGHRRVRQDDAAGRCWRSG